MGLFSVLLVVVVVVAAWVTWLVILFAGLLWADAGISPARLWRSARRAARPTASPPERALTAALQPAQAVTAAPPAG